MSRPKQREIACARCFRLKRKCDHAKPTCGECRRKGAECLPARSRRTGDSVTIPFAYLKELERRVADLEDSPRSDHLVMCDASVQTDLPLEESVDTPSKALWIPDTKDKSHWMDLAEENALVLFPETQQIRISRSPSRTPFTDIFSQFNENLDFLRFDKSPVYPLISDDSLWLTELYTNIYFSISHREWPFLNESAWKKWHCEDSFEGQEWKCFFLRMVYAIGASLCSSMHRNHAHLTRSKDLYASALNYYPNVVGHSSMVLQVQASLLLIVYALHSPSSEEIATGVSSILPFCTAAMTEIRKYARTIQDDESAVAGEFWTENMFITCYMLNEVIASGWDRPMSAAYRAVDDDLCILGDTIQPPVNTNPALGHLFRLRKIQSNIRRSLERSRWQFSEEKNGFNSSLKSALDIWRQDIPRYGTADVSCGYFNPNWMTKLYDYSILILMEEKRNFLDHEGIEDIFSAVAEVCMKYRDFQEEGHVLCFTWSALVFQFRAGIMLLYLIWATQSMDTFQQRHQAHEYAEAIEACTKNLSCFADRWDDAVPYYKMFQFLHQKIMWDADTSTLERLPSVEEAESYLEHLKKKYLHRAILGMIEDMMYGGFVRYEATLDTFVTGM
ncbi:WD repeat protein [Penicillium atrosanguineum]|uniref:WD repeat protein n=1 Tax=Penicillium atrosanguineum TaxID=1132637 RepID=UPI00239F83D9|nr:WD repeat protein [Penicillium atrosanguineum]KAJ5314515.1 WD repeat protein [Penicillium atrosanguineum]